MASIYGIGGMYQSMNKYRLINSLSSKTQVDPVAKIGNALGSYQNNAYQYDKQSMSTLSNKLKGALPKESLAFVQSYQGRMTQMMDAANTLRDTGSMAQNMAVSSSNTEVADATASWKLTVAASYTVDVQQLAAAQTNQTQAMETTGTELSGELNLLTSKGVYNFQADASASNNLDAMKNLAGQINDAKAGVTASVNVKDGKATLQLTSEKTGESNAFVASGSLAEATGLSTAAQEAQNAVYTIQKKGSILAPIEHVSESNNGIDVDDGLRVKADLKKVGSTDIAVRPDNNKTADAIQTMVDSFNSSLKLLNDNAERGDGVLKQMRRMILSPTSEKSMEFVGITTNKDGTLAFDREKYLHAASASPDLTKEIVSGSYGIANGIYNDAQQGLRQSASSLLSEDRKTAQLEAIYHPINLMASYNRAGMYNLSNYLQAGMLFNMLI